MSITLTRCATCADATHESRTLTTHDLRMNSVTWISLASRGTTGSADAILAI
jgi:hypothetical protein